MNDLPTKDADGDPDNTGGRPTASGGQPLPWILFGVAVIVIAGLVGFVAGRSSSPEAKTAAVTAPTTTTIQPPATSTTAAASATTLAPQERDFPDLFEDLQAAVAEVEVSGCNFGATGTAFMIADDLVVTAWHVVDGAAQITVEVGDDRIDASVIGRDVARDVALLRLDNAISGATLLPIAASPPRVGEEVAAMGHPRGLPLALTVGRVTSMNGTFDFGVDFDGEPLVIDDLIQTDAVVAPGNSGGPLINGTGEVVGVVVLLDLGAPGLMYASDALASAEQLDDWLVEPDPVEAAFCVGPIDVTADVGDVISSDVEHPEIGPLMRTYGVYQLAINSGRPEEAFQMLGPGIADHTTVETWAQGQSTSSLWAFRIRSVTEVRDGTTAGEALSVRVTFESTQAPEFGRVPGETCTRWDLTHRLVRGEVQGREFWLIDGAVANEGSPVSCAEF
ncbi:MAG: serine protease, partial [Actinomycetota bacterium]|nr:serine protease [Actinomycetota bacterium]